MADYALFSLPLALSSPHSCGTEVAYQHYMYFSTVCAFSSYSKGYVWEVTMDKYTG